MTVEEAAAEATATINEALFEIDLILRSRRRENMHPGGNIPAGVLMYLSMYMRS